MKTAIIYSGQLRGFRHTYPFIKKFVEPSFENITNFYFGPSPKEGYLFEDIIPNSVVEYEDDDLSLTKDWLDDVVLHGASTLSAERNGHKTKTMLQHWVMQVYNVYRSFQMVPEDFDLVVRMRPCCFPLDSLENYLTDNNRQLDDYTILTPKFDSYDSMNDRFAIGTYNAMKKYSSVFTTDELKKSGKRGESALHYVIQKNGISNVKIGWSFASVQNDGAVRNIPGGRGHVGSPQFPHFDEFIRKNKWIEGHGVYTEGYFDT